VEDGGSLLREKPLKGFGVLSGGKGKVRLLGIGQGSIKFMRRRRKKVETEGNASCGR